jgi:hypothetical protein
MNRQFSILVGVALILAGLGGMVYNLLAPLFDWDAWHWGAWRLWPLIVISIGAFLMLVPLVVRGQRGLGVLFIPATPILTIGGLLLFSSVFNAWSAWAWLWPLLVLAAAAGFLLAAVYVRTLWLVVPAIIIGANGLLFLFCAVTNMWDVWSVLWTIEPLSAGLALMVVSAGRRVSPWLFWAGAITCGLAGLGLVGMTTIISDWWLINLSGPVILMLAGFLMLVWDVLRRATSPGVAVE